MIEYWSWAIIGTVPSTARQRVIIIVVFVRRDFIAFGTIREHSRPPATERASNGGWQVVFSDEVTEHHFCNSHRCRCINLLRMLKNAFWDKMHVPRACSVARFVIAQCNWDAMHAPCACSVVQFVLAQCTLGCVQRQILRETFHGKDRRRHFEKFTKKLAKMHVNFPSFNIVNIRKDCLVRP